MGLIERLAANAGVSLTKRGSMLLVSQAEAARLLRQIAQENSRIIGIESFRLVGNNIVPVMEAIADFSGEPCAEATVSAAADFLSKLGSQELLLEFQVDGE